MVGACFLDDDSTFPRFQGLRRPGKARKRTLPLRIVHQVRFKTAEPITADSGVLFTTYTLLSDDFDGVIAFDEAHLMNNAAATPHGGKAIVDHGTLRGNMGTTLQRLFPQARVRYFSATGATEARHMAPYERLGLWGAGAPFADFATFLVAMERGGLAAMETQANPGPDQHRNTIRGP